MGEDSLPDEALTSAIMAELERVSPEMLSGFATDVPLPPITPIQALAALVPLPDGAGPEAVIRALYRETGIAIPRPGDPIPWLRPPES